MAWNRMEKYGMEWDGLEGAERDDMNGVEEMELQNEMQWKGIKWDGREGKELHGTAWKAME